MNQFYFGNNQEYIEAAYAPSGRSTCKACKQKIQIQSIRLAYIIESGHFSSVHWYHLNCFELKPKFIDIDPEQQVYNIDQLDANQTDYQMAIDYINAEKERLKRGDKRSKPVPVQQANKTSAKKQEKKPEKDDESVKEESQDDSQKVSKKQQKKKKKQEKLPALPAYTHEQQKTYEELVQKYNGYSADTLKQYLANNKQSKTGTKAELVDKCADGKILGQIPHCPSCGGGRPKFDKETSTYKCPGYMDDDKYRHCHKTFKMEEIKREKWID